MTHEQFVSLETAKLLKQAGFDWDSSFTYLSEEYNQEYDEWKQIASIEVPNPDYNSDRFFNEPLYFESPTKTIVLPHVTQAVAQRWLREVKDKLIMLDFCTAEPNKFMAIITDTKFPVSSTAATTDKWSDTYEAALEAGLQKCLTLLIEKQ